MPDTDTATQSVEPQPAPAAGLPDQVNPAAMGAGVGSAVEQASMIGVRVDYDRQQQQAKLEAQAGEVEGQHAINTLRNTALAGLHGDGGLFTTNPGANALQASASWQEKRQAQVAQIRENIQNPDALKSFDRAAADNAYETQAQIDQFNEHQIKQADAQVTQGALQTAFNGVIAHASDPAMFNHHIALGAAALIDSDRRNGVPASATQSKIADWTSGAVTGAISTLVDSGQSSQAQALAEAHKNEILGDDVGKVAKLIQHGDVNDRGLALSRSIISGLPPVDPTKPDSQIGEGLVAARAGLDKMGITDDALYHRALDEIDTHYKLAADAYTTNQSSMLTKAQAAVDANPSGAIPPSVTSGMNDMNQKKAEEYRQWKIKDLAPKDNPDTVNYFHQALANPEQWRDQLGDGTSTGPLRLELQQRRAELSAPTYQRINQEMDQTVQKVVRNDQSLSQGQVSTEATNRIFDEAGLPADAKPGTPERSAQDSLRGTFMLQLHRLVGAEALKLQRPLTPDEIEDKARALYATKTWTETVDNPQGPQHQSWLGIGMDIATGDPGQPETMTRTQSQRVFETPEAQARAYSIRDVPIDERSKILKSFASKNYSPNEDELIAAYNQRITQK